MCVPAASGLAHAFRSGAGPATAHNSLRDNVLSATPYHRGARGTSVALLVVGTMVGASRTAVRGVHANARLTDALGRKDIMTLIQYLRALLRQDSGQDLLEYALLVALIALVAVGAVTLTGNGVDSIFTAISNQLTTAASGGGGGTAP
jgi:pilus assembly protein Flp/PilA